MEGGTFWKIREEKWESSDEVLKKKVSRRRKGIHTTPPSLVMESASIGAPRQRRGRRTRETRETERGPRTFLLFQRAPGLAATYLHSAFCILHWMPCPMHEEHG